MKAYLVIIAGAAIGALAGWFYWKYVGCETGTCPITARPLSSTLYGALLGALLFYSFTPVRKNKGNNSEQQIEKNDRKT
jgi:H+/Cl- antiporter ClcA